MKILIKKILFYFSLALLICLVFLMSQPGAIRVFANANPLPPTAIGIFNGIDEVQSTVEKSIPVSFLDRIKNYFAVVETWRIYFGSQIITEREMLEGTIRTNLLQQLNAKNQLENADVNTFTDQNYISGGNPLKQGILQFEVFLLTFVSYFFTISAVFYVCLALVVFWILRSLYRIIRARRRV